MLWDLGCLLSTSFGIFASATKKIISFVSFFDMFGNIRLWWQGKKHFITPLNITFLLSFHFEMPGHDLLSASENYAFCSSQPSMVYWLSSSIFPCSFVCSSRYGNIWPNLHFFSIYTGIQALYPYPVSLNTKQYQVMLTQHHQVPTSTALY